jgi:hypothetical protein
MRESKVVDYTSSAEQILALFAEDSATAPGRWKPKPGEEYWFIWDTALVPFDVIRPPEPDFWTLPL